MSKDLIKDPEFKQWISDLKVRIRQSQFKAAIKVNSELLHLYWELGHDIVVRQMDAVWGSGFFERLSKELKKEFPDMKGFSTTNLKYCKYFYLFYSKDGEVRHQFGDETYYQSNTGIEVTVKGSDIIRHQAGDELENHPIFQIPWRHHVEIFTKCKSVEEALFYIQKTITNGWSRAVLMNFLDANLYQSQGRAINNFDRLLPNLQSDLAKETLKDPYNFDFLTLTEIIRRRS